VIEQPVKPIEIPNEKLDKTLAENCYDYLVLILTDISDKTKTAKEIKSKKEEFNKLTSNPEFMLLWYSYVLSLCKEGNAIDDLLKSNNLPEPNSEEVITKEEPESEAKPQPQVPGRGEWLNNNLQELVTSRESQFTDDTPTDEIPFHPLYKKLLPNENDYAGTYILYPLQQEYDENTPDISDKLVSQYEKLGNKLGLLETIIPTLGDLRNNTPEEVKTKIRENIKGLDKPTDNDINKANTAEELFKVLEDLTDELTKKDNGSVTLVLRTNFTEPVIKTGSEDKFKQLTGGQDKPPRHTIKYPTSNDEIVGFRDVLKSGENFTPNVNKDLDILFTSEPPFDNLLYMSYGYSGSGKTYFLLNADDSILKAVINKIDNIEPKPKVKIVLYDYYGECEEKNVVTNINPHKITYYLNEKIPKEIKEKSSKIIHDNIEQELTLENLLTNIDIFNTKRKENLANEPDKDERHIRITPNNPESSRSHLFIDFYITLNDNTKRKITILDMAGSENVKALYEGYYEVIRGAGKPVNIEDFQKKAQEFIKMYKNEEQYKPF
ncbi:MAG: hypothetical protein EBU66_20010, partial [Bacteroidetes bacterium]|nr:hypothetical protein [Bacteroidota bacterium]